MSEDTVQYNTARGRVCKKCGKALTVGGDAVMEERGLLFHPECYAPLPPCPDCPKLHREVAALRAKLARVRTEIVATLDEPLYDAGGWVPRTDGPTPPVMGEKR